MPKKSASSSTARTTDFPSRWPESVDERTKRAPWPRFPTAPPLPLSGRRLRPVEDENPLAPQEVSTLDQLVQLIQSLTCSDTAAPNIPRTNITIGQLMQGMAIQEESLELTPNDMAELMQSLSVTCSDDRRVYDVPEREIQESPGWSTTLLPEWSGEDPPPAPGPYQAEFKLPMSTGLPFAWPPGRK